MSTGPSWLTLMDKGTCEHVGSFVSVKEMPNLGKLPEIALAGRSNVGKSSALNALVGGRKKMAVVSKTPGRTRVINLFKAGKACVFADLPGYGYAKVSREMQVARNLGRLREQLGLPDDQPLPLSSTTLAGRRELWRYLQEVCQEIEAERRAAEDES